VALKRSFWASYKLRVRRKRFLWRAFRKRRELNVLKDRTRQIRPDDVLLFMTLRNEEIRLPHFMNHYRDLGVSHFLCVDNGSTDGSTQFLAAQPDVSLWKTNASYKAARFGMDWLTWLLRRHGSGHWCLTVDADELLVYPDCHSRSLVALTDWLDARGLPVMGAMMLDMYPKGRIEDRTYAPGQNPTQVLAWFDAYGYWAQRKTKMDNLWVQGGPRARCFFGDDPRRAPTLNKIPLIKWKRSYVYVNSTHNCLPVRLNRTYDEPGIEKPNGVLLHTKFLPGSAGRARHEQARKEHFSNSSLYDDYYLAVSENPDLWSDGSVAYEGPEQLEKLGLMTRGGW
jgi:hypothetical protein